MNEQFFHDRARQIRALAEKADPFTRIRLLELADRYAKKPRPPTPIVTPKGSGLTGAVGFVEEVLSIPSGGLGVLVDGDDDGVDVPVAPTFTSRLVTEIVQGRQEG